MHSDLVVFGEDWGCQPTGTHHLVRHLGTGRKVVWINSPVPRCCPTCPHNHPPPQEMAEYRPNRILASLGRYLANDSAERSDNQQMLGHQIRMAMAALELRRPILLTSVPTAMHAVGEIDEHAIVYYCDTDFARTRDLEHCPMAAMEAELAVRADLIIAVTPELARRFPSHRTVVIDQDEGADGSWIARAATMRRLLDRLA
jgi:hypothetical protein